MNNLLFPIETIGRELDHKILMAIACADKDNRVYIGDQQIIRTLSFFVKKGIFYGKHLFGKPMFSNTNYYYRLKKNHINLVHLNEEGAVWPGKENIWKLLLNQAERPAVLDKNDVMLTWGKWQEEYNSSREDHSTKIKTTGHPRFDLYNKKFLSYFQSDIKDIKNKYGDYILINTAFSYSNNGEGGVDFIFKPTLSYSPKEKESRLYRFQRWKQQMFSIADVVNLVNNLSLDFPEKLFIVRPHPSEDTAYYKSIFNGIDNVKVIYEGSATPWLLGCDGLIHNGCTTAIEATLAGKPVLNYVTNPDPEFDTYLANICGKTVNNYNDAYMFIQNLASQEVSLPTDISALNLFANFNGHLVYKDVVNEIKSTLEKSKNQKEKYPSYLKLKTLGLAHKVYITLKYTYLLLKGHPKKYIDYKKRFNGFNKKDIENRVKILSKIIDKKVKFKYISKHLFIIESKND